MHLSSEQTKLQQCGTSLRLSLWQDNVIEQACCNLQGGLSPPAPLGGSLLLPRAWSLLLRLLLQSGVPPETLKSLTQLSAASQPLGTFKRSDADLEEEIWRRLPTEAKGSWLDNPHRMVSLEAEVRHYSESSMRFESCKRNSLHFHTY